jgi:RNA polymerase sigma factor for flagellar operon FliA
MDENALLEQYEAMIRSIARHFKETLPTRMDFADLCQIGRMALIEASRKFDPNAGMGLESWLRLRIRGTIIDRMHKSTGASRTAMRHYRRQRAFLDAQESALHAAPAEDSNSADFEFVTLMFEAIATVQDIYAQGTDDQIDRAIGITPGESNHPSNPEDVLLEDEGQTRLSRAIQSLTEPERTILELHYLKEVSITEIALRLELSRPWVSKLHMRALRQIREILADE